MNTMATRSRRLALGCALITAVTLGTVSASAATASGTRGTPSSTGRPGPGIGVSYTPTANAPGDVGKANPAFARCMRGAGQKQFPDFHATRAADGSFTLQVKANHGGFPAHTTKYEAAIKKCAPLLKKAGITIPAAPGKPGSPDSPPSPGRPGKGQGKGKGTQVIPGKPAELPSLTRSPENA